MYEYVGPREILSRVVSHPVGSPIHTKADIERWSRQHREGGGSIPTTFVVDSAGVLLLSERHSEHVVCAGGAPVLAAGELMLEGETGLEVTSITNQSTGYCPDAQSWGAIQTALSRLGVPFPERFTHTFIFRRCEACEQTNVVKDDDYRCSVCAHELPKQ